MSRGRGRARRPTSPSTPFSADLLRSGLDRVRSAPSRMRRGRVRRCRSARVLHASQPKASSQPPEACPERRIRLVGGRRVIVVVNPRRMVACRNRAGAVTQGGAVLSDRRSSAVPPVRERRRRPDPDRTSPATTSPDLRAALRDSIPSRRRPWRFQAAPRGAVRSAADAVRRRRSEASCRSRTPSRRRAGDRIVRFRGEARNVFSFKAS